VKGAPLVLLAWALLLAVHTTVLVALGGDTLEVALLGGAAAGVAVLALVVALRRRDAGPRAVRDLSPPAALAAVAVAGLVVASELGMWLLLISGGLLVLALGGLVRE
jgi:uncharacterized membrane protein